MSEEETLEKIDVDAILSTKQSQYKSIEVDKDVDVELDIGNLLATDTSVLQSDELKLVKFLVMGKFHHFAGACVVTKCITCAFILQFLIEICTQFCKNN